MEIMSTNTQRCVEDSYRNRVNREMCISTPRKFYCCSIVRVQLKLNSETPDGGVAQLGEHLPCKQGVMGSNPIISTSKVKSLEDDEPDSPRDNGL